MEVHLCACMHACVCVCMHVCVCVCSLPVQGLTEFLTWICFLFSLSV